jgi:hypothetical protein
MGISGSSPNACPKPLEFCVISKLEILISITMSEIKKIRFHFIYFSNKPLKQIPSHKFKKFAKSMDFNQWKSKVKNKSRQF